MTIRFAQREGGFLEVVRDLSFELAVGESICIVGRSGSGKTSVIRSAAGLTRPESGEVRWWDQELFTLSDDDLSTLRRTRVGYVDQGSSLVSDLTTLENVLLPLLPSGRQAVRRKRTEATEILDQLGLGDRLRQTPEVLSGGERQRTAIARALITDPELLIVDEPTASLDRRWADKIIDLIFTQGGARRAVLVASHDENVARASGSTIHIESLRSVGPIDEFNTVT